MSTLPNTDDHCHCVEDAAKAVLLELLTREDFVTALKDLTENLMRSGRSNGSGMVTINGEAEEVLAFAVTMLREPLLQWLDKGVSTKH
jgi:hypothetical protein